MVAPGYKNENNDHFFFSELHNHNPDCEKWSRRLWEKLNNLKVFLAFSSRKFSKVFRF